MLANRGGHIPTAHDLNLKSCNMLVSSDDRGKQIGLCIPYIELKECIVLDRNSSEQFWIFQMKTFSKILEMSKKWVWGFF